MKISVAMAIYNGGEYLEEQLKSICKQTHKVDEIIVVDDCSAQSSLKLINQVIIDYDVDVKYQVHQYNKGYAQTFFDALHLCTGDIIFISDQDDIWLPERVDKFVNIMESNKQIQCLSCLNEIIDGTGEHLKYEKKFLHSFCPISPEDVISTKKLRPGMSLAITSSLNKKLISMDLSKFKQHDRLIEVVAASESGYYIFNDILTKYRIHGHNTSGLNLSIKPRTDISGRIKQIDKELDYLVNLKKLTIVSRISNIDIMTIEKYIQYYNNRKLALNNNIFSYLRMAIKNANLYIYPRIFFGDLYALFRRKRFMV